MNSPSIALLILGFLISLSRETMHRNPWGAPSTLTGSSFEADMNSANHFANVLVSTGRNKTSLQAQTDGFVTDNMF